MLVLASVITSPAPFSSPDKGVSKQQHRDSNRRPAGEENLLHHGTERRQTLRRRVRNKTSLRQGIILATRSTYFRVQETQVKPARLLERAVTLPQLCPSLHHKSIGPTLTFLHFFSFFNCLLIVMGLLFSWVGELTELCSPVGAGPRAKGGGRTQPTRQDFSSALAAPELCGRYLSQSTKPGPSRRVFPH